MQISRRILLACVATSILFPQLSNAADTEAQRKAREALEKFQQGSSPSPATESVPAVKVEMPAVQPKPETSKATAPAAPRKPAAAAVTSQSIRQTGDTEAQKKAREALERHQQQSQQTPAPAMTEAPAVQPTEPRKSAPVFESVPGQPGVQKEAVTSEGPAFEPVPTAANPNAEKAAQALREKMEKPAAEPAMAQPSKSGAPAKKTQVSRSKKDAEALPPIQGPATGLSAEKEQKLNALLDEYRADRLTPAQYHERRAKILAEP